MRTTPGLLTFTAFTAIVALTGAACTSEQQSNPSPTLTSTTSTTIVSTTAPTTEPVVETTAATTTTEAPPTTTTVPAGPTDAIVPLLIGGGDGGGWLSLGSWQSDRWEDAFDDADEPIVPAVSPGTPVTVTWLAGGQAGTAGDHVEACFDERVGPTLDVGVAAPQPPGFGYSSVALVTQGWSPLLRPIAVTSTGPASYQEIGEAIFAGQPVDATAGSVQQVVVTDLDGDGDDEALVAFEFIQPGVGPGVPGDLAALYLVDADTRVSSTVLEAHVPSDLPAEAFPITERFRVIAVADYNGDGRSEVAVHAWYYEGASVLLYEYDGTSLRQVLTAGCGA